MPVSPTVNSYQMQGQAPQYNSAEQIFNNKFTDAAFTSLRAKYPQYNSAEQIFNNKFTDAAFTSLRAKYPQLASIVVTFKVIEADVETGAGVGAFILRTAGDVAYIPVVMSGGAIASCEMLYNKQANSFLPLLPKVVQDVVNANKVETATLLSKAPRVEDTRGLFRNMTRPPHSSNAILASNDAEHAVRSLPNSAKTLVTEYLENTPELLAKIAEFYPVEVLAAKLAKVAEENLPKVDFPDVVSIETLKEDTLKALTPDEREAVLRDGYAVRKNIASKPIEVLPTGSLSASLEKEFSLSEVSSIEDQPNLIKAGYVFSTIDGGMRLKKALIFSPRDIVLDGHKALFSRGYGAVDCCSSTAKHVVRPDSVIASQVRPATTGDLISFGCVPVNKCSDTKESTAVVVYPVRSGYKVFATRLYGDFTVNKTDGSVSIDTKFGPQFIFTEELKRGVVDDTRDSRRALFPYNSFLFLIDKSDDRFPIIRDMGTVLKYLQVMGKNLQVIDDGAQILVNDKATKTTKALEKKADAAKYLVDTYGFGATEVDTAFRAKNVFVFDKTAFLTQPAIQDQAMTSQQMVAPVMQQQPGFQPQMLDDFAELSDPEMMDTGILASFAQDADIKENFVDLLPSFSEALTSVGRTILLCSVRKKDLEEYYGREKYQSFVASCKRVFKTLGEIVVGLKEYINMND